MDSKKLEKTFINFKNLRENKIEIKERVELIGILWNYTKDN